MASAVQGLAPAPPLLRRSAVGEHWGDVGRRLARNRAALVGAVLVASFVCSGLLAPWLAPRDPLQQNFLEQLQAPNVAHLLGTDEFGRDILSRIIYGSRISLQVGAIAASLSLVVGVVLGLVGAYYGGWADGVVQRLMEVMLAFPYLLLIIAIVAILGPGLTNAMIAVGITNIPRYARIVRGSVLSVRARDFVEAARTVGAGDGRLMWRHVLPNASAPVIVQATLSVGTSIIETAGVSFLGVGAQPPTPDWGAMLSSGRNYLIDAPWLCAFPGLAILLAVLAFNLLGDGLRDAMDPRLR